MPTLLTANPSACATLKYERRERARGQDDEVLGGRAERSGCLVTMCDLGRHGEPHVVGRRCTCPASTTRPVREIAWKVSVSPAISTTMNACSSS
jgi:hypothetical protein